MSEELAAPPLSEAPTAAPMGPPETLPPGGAGAPRRRRRWPAIVAIAIGAVVLLALLIAPFIHVPYVIIGPGDATALDQSVVQVHGVPTYDDGNGELLYLTVTVSNRDPNLYRWLFAKLDPDTDVSKKQSVIGGCASYAESNRLAVSAMGQSQETAKAVALRRLGYTIDNDAGPVQVVDVICGGPSEGKLELGDQIVAIDGQPVNRAEDVRPPLVAHRPGETAVFTVLRDGERQNIDVRLGARKDPTTNERLAYAGIYTQQEIRHELPVTVDIDTQRVSGPSAGLAFTLAIIDQLTPGSLTGGKHVAVTGTIGEDGTVGVVGGVKQKAVTARRAGAKLMIVPTDEVADARARAGDMKVVGVQTLDDALRALERAGGAPIATPAVPAQ
jgi:PDZ domain-containing protein